MGKRWSACAAVLGFVLLCAEAQAQYRPPPRQEEPEPADEFGDAVSLKRFRRGSIGWDTQELIASGLTALHKEHLEILKELRELRGKLGELQGRLDELQQKMESAPAAPQQP